MSDYNRGAVAATLFLGTCPGNSDWHEQTETPPKVRRTGRHTYFIHMNFPHDGKSRQHSTDHKLGCGPLFLSPALKIQLKTTFFSVCLKTNLYDASLGTKATLYLLQPHRRSFMFK